MDLGPIIVATFGLRVVLSPALGGERLIAATIPTRTKRLPTGAVTPVESQGRQSWHCWPFSPQTKA